jgi:hypothetical protein
MSRAAALPPVLADGPFTFADGRQHGLSPSRLRAADLARPHRAVRVPAGSPDDLLGRCRALLPLLPEDARFGDLTALRLRGADLPWPLDADDRLHVEVGTADTRPRIRGVVAHRHAGPAAVRTHLGLPVLAPEVAWTRVGARAGPTELVLVADALCRRRSPVCAPADLLRAVEALPPGTRGVRRLRVAAERCRAGTDSIMETRARLVLEDAGVVCEVNRPVHDARGRFVAMPDLSDVSLQVAIEYDGDVHRTDRRTWRRDVARRQALEAAGWRVVTLTADDLHHPDHPWLRWVAQARRSQSRVLR